MPGLYKLYSENMDLMFFCRLFFVGGLFLCSPFTCLALNPGCYNLTEDGLFCQGVNVGDVRFHVGIKSVTLNGTSTPYAGVFMLNQNWKRIETLKIFSDHEQRLNGDNFMGLENLRHLEFHNPQLWSIGPRTFVGLKRLESLDLSNTTRPNVTQVMNSLAFADLPLLEKLNIGRVDTYYPNSATMADEFFFSISKNGTRKLKYLDISDFKISKLDYNGLFKYGLCKSLETIVCHRCVLLEVDNYWTGTCESLRVVDFSNMIFGMSPLPLDVMTTNFFCWSTKFYNNIEKMVMPGVFKKDLAPPMLINGYEMNNINCPYRIKYMDFSNNNLQWLNISAKLHPVTAESFEWADISDNLLEYISPNFLAPSFNVRYLSLTGNMLFVMQTEYPSDFEILLRGQRKLKTLLLARNRLTQVPRKMFASNSELTVLDLSDNQLTSIDFDIGHLKRLRYLNLSGNKISFLSPAFRTQFNALVKNLGTGNRSLKMNLGRNAFSCNCEGDSIENLQWIKSNTPYLTVSGSDQYSCQLYDDRLNLLTDAFEMTEHQCYMRKVKVTISIGAPILATVVLVLGIFLIVKRRRIQRRVRFQRRYDTVVTQIQTKSFPKERLVFVSCCSADNDLVTDYFMPGFTSMMSKMLKTESRDLVCRGDVVFRPGFSISGEIIRCVNETAVVVLIVSKQFCEKNWCKMEMQEAYDQRKPIVLVMLEQVDVRLMNNILRKIFEKYTHASWISTSNGGRLEPDWETFCRSIIGLAGKEIEKNSPHSQVSFNSKNVVSNELNRSTDANVESITFSGI